MPWALFSVALLILFMLQTAVLPYFAPAWLDPLLLLALVCGLTAPARDACLAAWATGFAKDLDSAGPLGLHALALGLAVLALTRLRELVNLHQWWVRALVSFVVAWPAELLVRLHQRFWQGVELGWGQMLIHTLTSALAAALLAALVTALPKALRSRRRRSFATRW